VAATGTGRAPLKTEHLVADVLDRRQRARLHAYGTTRSAGRTSHPVRSVEAVDKSLPHAAAPADDRQVEDRAPCGAEEVGAIFASWLAERYPGARWVIEPGKERRATGLRPDRGRSSGRSAARRTRSRSGAPCSRHGQGDVSRLLAKLELNHRVQIALLAHDADVTPR
jgi:hypothetical protein